MLSGFAIRHPGQRQVPQLVLDKVVEAMLFENTHQLYKY